MSARTGMRSARRGSLALATGVAGLATACTWVALTPQGEAVRLADVSAVSACEKLGKVNTTTAQKAGFFPRSAAKVQRELATLARNEAAKMGGDTVAGVTEVRNGARTFEVYRCRGDG